VQNRSHKRTLFALYITIFTFYIFVGTLAAHPFDDYIYARHAQYFYYMNVNPAYGLPMGLYYDLINIGGYFVTILLNAIGIVNVLSIQIGVKIPFIIFAFLTAYLVSRILEDMGYKGIYAGLILLTSPVYFFTSVIYGSPIVISIFFLIYSIYLLFRRKTLFSAALFGMSIGSYLYPLLSLPILVRFLYKHEGKRETAIYIAVTTVFAAIGQLTVLYLYTRMGLYSISPNIPSGYVSSVSLPYYSIFDLFAILKISGSVPGSIYSFTYYIASIVAAFSYFLIKKENVDRHSLLIFFLIQGVIFSALNPGNLPSYMSAMIPFAIIIAILSKRWVLVGMVWIASVFDFLVIQTINPSGLFIYFSDLNSRILSWKNSYLDVLVYIFSFLYSLSLLLIVPVSLRPRQGKMARFKKTLASQYSMVGVFCVIGILVLVPVASNIPVNMYLSSNLNTFDAQPVNESLSGHSLSVEYLIPTIGFLTNRYLGYFVGSIQPPSQPEIVYNYSKNYVSRGMNFTEELALPYPINNVLIELFAKENGTINLELINATSTLTTFGTKQVTNDYIIFRYEFSSVLSGSYSLNIKSTVPVYMYNESSVSILLIGSPQAGVAIVNNIPLQGGYIPGYLLKSKLQITFTGPFQKLPPFIPSVLVYLAKSLVKPVSIAIFEGGIIFLLLVAVPSYAMFFRRKGKSIFDRG
jgi:hypothetical protein